MLKIQVFNYQTGEIQQTTLTPETKIQGQCIIGRSASCDLVLNSPEVSRVHGKIMFQKGHYYFTDLCSTDGSRINNSEAKVDQCYVLKENDVIRIGEFVLTIEGVETPPSRGNATLSGGLDSDRRWTSGDLTVRCVQVIDETADVKTFRFVADPPVLFTYNPGQFVNLELEVNGEPVLRSYYISSTPSRPHILEITIKRVGRPTDEPNVPADLVSNWLHYHITVGTSVKLRGGPMGKFTCLAKPSQKLLMISAGSGIAPMMSMSRWIYDTAEQRDIVFFHSARSPREIIFQQELELMASRHPNFRLAITTTQSEPGQARLGNTCRLTESMLSSVAPDFRERTVYVCGPDSFMQGVKAMLEGLGFPMQNYYEQSFGSPAEKVEKVAKLRTKGEPAPTAMAAEASPRFGLPDPLGELQPPGKAVANGLGPLPETSVSVPAPSLASPFSQPAVFFVESGIGVPSDGEKSILELAEQHGVKICSSCRQGVCGTCKKRKLGGQIKYTADPVALEDSEQAEFILTCIATPVGRIVVEA